GIRDSHWIFTGTNFYNGSSPNVTSNFWNGTCSRYTTFNWSLLWFCLWRLYHSNTDKYTWNPCLCSDCNGRISFVTKRFSSESINGFDFILYNMRYVLCLCTYFCIFTFSLFCIKI